MLTVNGVSLRFGSRVLFEDVNLKFTKGNCYGVIGANGAGKSTFLKILSGEIEPNKGEVSIGKNERISVLGQNHFAYEDENVLDVVIMGNEELYNIMVEKDKIYQKADFSEEDGMKAAKLEERFAELDGWNAESDAMKMLTDLGIEEDKMYGEMKELAPKDKVKVLLAKALFGEPDVLLLDEPTNDLDIQAIEWLEDFLIDYENTVIVVSHDRYFLNTVCTYIADVDYGKIKLFPGNYDFWYQSNALLQKQMRDSNQKKEEKIRELKDFIARFGASQRARQATSRKRTLEKIQLEEIVPSNRRYPYIDFKPERLPGKEIIKVNHIWKKEGETEIKDIAFDVKEGDKILFLTDNENELTLLFDLIAGEKEVDKGYVEYGKTITVDYLPKHNDKYFDSKESITDWLRKYSKDPDETYVRSFLGRMLFSGEEALKSVNVLSGGEKVRCMLSKMMLSGANVLIFDEPTNHLDMESITTLNDAMKKFPGVILFTSHDHELANTVANKIIDLRGDRITIREKTYDEYLEEILLQKNN